MYSDKSSKNINKIKEIEVKLVEQEHRPIPIFINLFKWSFGKYKDRRLRWASIKAVLFYLLSPGMIVAGGGLLAFLTWWEMSKQTDNLIEQKDAMLDQNKAIVIQNEHLKQDLDNQTAQFDQQRLTDLTKILYDENTALNIRMLKSAAFPEYLNLLRKRQKGGRIDVQYLILNGLQLDGLNIDSVNFFDVKWNNADILRTNFRGCNFYNTEFKGTYLGSTKFSGCRLSLGTSFTGKSAKLSYVAFDSSVLNCDFSGSTLHGCTFQNSPIDYSNFKDVNITYLKDIDASTFLKMVKQPIASLKIRKKDISMIYENGPYSYPDYQCELDSVGLDSVLISF